MKNLLICVSGLTPQIITESLFCISVKKKIPIHEIYILTTARGRNVILGADKDSVTPKSRLKNELLDLCKKYKLKTPKFEENDSHIIVAKEESIELYDIRTDRHNLLFPNKVCEFIRSKTIDPNNILYCTISGGRKTMSVNLAFALSLFGRENDKLLHVLTREEHEFKGFYPITKKETRDLEIAEIPYVRLRSILAHETKTKDLFKLNFDKIVQETQKELKILSDERKLICSVDKRELKFGTKSVHFEPLEFALYFHLIDLKSRTIEFPTIHQLTSIDSANSIKSFIEEKYDYYYFNESIRNPWWKAGLSAENFRSKRTKINSKIKTLIPDFDLSSQFTIESIKNYGQTSYHIPADIKKFKLQF
ncbi:MAG: TIGR02584 family CRISPR-associated protein [Bacteroidetes bacterium]|nr:TIGR02584 family CRISPR-associated protein [Bacteroidota bacterium]MBU2584301.1 TIGR02584 family CRISPR-associated protein [Bacteroidota bacterium]